MLSKKSPIRTSQSESTTIGQSEMNSTRKRLAGGAKRIPPSTRAFTMRPNIRSVGQESEPPERATESTVLRDGEPLFNDHGLPQNMLCANLQNLQGGNCLRPVNLQDLERLESLKFVMPQQEIINRTTKRPAMSIESQESEGDEFYRNEEPNQEALYSMVPTPVQIPLERKFPSNHSIPLAVPIMDQHDFKSDLDHADKRSIAEPDDTIIQISRTTIPQSARPLVLFTSLVAISVLQGASNCLSRVLQAVNMGVHAPKDMVRIRWTCKCGKRLYDDFIEKRPGAARNLELYLNRPRQRGNGTGVESSPASIFSDLSMPSSISYSSRATALDSADISNAKTSKSRSSYIPALAASGSQFGIDNGPFHEQLWLLTCAERHKFTTRLMHLDMDPYRVCSDKDLALIIKEQYSRLRPSWRQFLRLRSLYTIQFVQFEVHRSQVVDIRKCPDLPEKSNINYKFLPSDIIPPVGENYLMHLFHHPEDYEDELITYRRIPKKRGTKLRVCDSADVGVGWGVHLVEGFLAYKVWTLFTVLFALASLVFGVVWTFRKGDIQGAFGVSAYICALSTLVIGCGMAYLE